MRFKLITCGLSALLIAGCVSSMHEASIMADRTWFIFLETNKPVTDKVLGETMQRGHIANFKRLFDLKKLSAAGPLQDPSGLKRGIVVVAAPSRAIVESYFQPDQYVRDGYMVLNAVPCTVHKPLNTSGIDPNGIEEVRIVQIMRTADEQASRRDRLVLKGLVANGSFGAWYSPETGPVAEILFSRTTDNKKLLELIQQNADPLLSGREIKVWRQWLSKGVVS